MYLILFVHEVLKDKIGKCNDEIAALMAEQELFMKYRHPLSKTQMQIGTLADKIDALSTIWQRVSAQSSLKCGRG